MQLMEKPGGHIYARRNKRFRTLRCDGTDTPRAHVVPSSLSLSLSISTHTGSWGSPCLLDLERQDCAARHRVRSSQSPTRLAS